MLSQADLQRALALALGEFAPAWKIVGDCAAVDPSDSTHWDSGAQSFQVTLRHRVTGHLKVLGRRVSYEPRAHVHPALALSLIETYRHGNAEPIRRYLEDIGVAAITERDATHFFRRPSVDASSGGPGFETAGLLAASTAVTAPTGAVSPVDSAEADVEAEAPRAGVSRSWSLTIGRPRWPSRLTVTSRRRREPSRPAVPDTSLGAAMPAATVGARRPMLSRLRRELEIWQWRRAASGSSDKRPARD